MNGHIRKARFIHTWIKRSQANYKHNAKERNYNRLTRQSGNLHNSILTDEASTPDTHNSPTNKEKERYRSRDFPWFRCNCWPLVSLVSSARALRSHVSSVHTHRPSGAKGAVCGRSHTRLFDGERINALGSFYMPWVTTDVASSNTER